MARAWCLSARFQHALKLASLHPQAEKVGDRLYELLKPALSTPGREADVRIHVSTLTRAKETADLIASRLPSHVTKLAPNPNLVEGTPPAHIIPHRGEEFLLKRSRYTEVEPWVSGMRRWSIA